MGLAPNLMDAQLDKTICQITVLLVCSQRVRVKHLFLKKFSIFSFSVCFPNIMPLYCTSSWMARAYDTLKENSFKVIDGGHWSDLRTFVFSLGFVGCFECLQIPIKALEV